MRFLNKLLSLSIAVILVCNTSVLGERWSRQLTQDSPAAGNDWVPIRNGKSISYGEDLATAAQNQFQFFAEPLNNRFNLQQQHPSGASPSEINSFSSQNSPPPFQFFNQQKQRTVQSFGGPIGNKPNAEPLVQSQPPPFQYMQEVQRGPHVHHYQSQPIPKSLQNFPQSQPIPQFQHLTQQQPRVPQFQNLPPPPQFQPISTPPEFQPPQGEQQQPQSDEQVQLLYVPFDSLYQQNQQQQQSAFNEEKSNRFNILNQPVSASLINDFYSQNEVQEFPTKPATTKRPSSSSSSSTRRPTVAPITSSLKTTTPFETISKPKPHQPPLSMFVAIDKFKGKVTEADVLNTLKNSNSIDVMDSFSKNSPKVFIGPSGMIPPAGYSKFDLPYLSNIEGTRHERRIEQLPFFVAPLSYRTPPGFSKIPLPAPHVGSVVVNQPPNTIESNESSGFTQDSYYTKQPIVDQSHLNPSNLDPSQKSQKITLTSGFNYSPSGVQLIRNEFTFPTLAPTRETSPSLENQQRSVYTTARPTFAQTASPSTAETPLTKVAYKHIEEKRNYGQSTHNPTTTRTPVTKTNLDYFPSSPRSTARATTTKVPPFIELEEHKTINEEYFGFEKEKKPTFSFKFGSDVDKPRNNFNFRPIPDFDFGETDYVTTKKPRTKLTTQAPIPETQRTVSQYTFPSSTASPTASFEYNNPTVSVIENTEEFGQVNGGSAGNFFEYRSSPRPTTQDFSYNRFSLGNEQTYSPNNAYTSNNNAYTPQYLQETKDDVSAQPENYANVDDIATTDNPDYSLPSELPSISPQLPGWINSLMEDKWMQTPNITEESTTTTTTTTTTTRRPISRGSRRPVTSTYRSTAAESTGDRRPVTSRRRPTTYTSRNSDATTEATFPSRSTVSRGSKVKYNATSEERGKFRTRNRQPSTPRKEKEDINYQRDVLNQNYPSVRPIATEPSTEKLVEEPYNVQYQPDVLNTDNLVNDYNTPLESVEVIPLGGNSNDNNDETITFTTTSTTQATPLPSNHKYSNSFVGLQEPMQVPHHKAINPRLKGNFNFKNRNIDSFYNTNSQDSTTHKTEHEDDQILLTVPTTQATTRFTTVTEAAPTDSPIPRRTNFPRRRLTYTTTESPSTSSDSDTTESTGGRTRGRKENVVVVKKLRSRTRPTTSTELPDTTRRNVAVRTRASYNANRNTNRESTRERGTDKDEENKPRFRIRENTPRFRLDTQESQWSSRFSQNSFQPLDEEKSKSLKDAEVDDEQEIVTASSSNEKDVYLVNVSASVTPTKPAERVEYVDETINMITTTEKDIVVGKRIKNEDDLGSSFDKFVKDVLEDIEDEAKSETKADKKPIGNEKKVNARRGVWKKIKVRPADAFETAETQYVGKSLFNAVSNDDKAEGEKQNRFDEPEETSTTAKAVEIEPTEIISTRETPLEHVFSETTTSEPEFEETKPGMFDEARKALSELFSSEDDADDAVNMEQADDKLEALNDSTTTTLIPPTEESTTIAPTTAAETSTTKPEESIVKKSSKQVKTSQSQKVTGEICYRGRCIKTDEK